MIEILYWYLIFGIGTGVVVWSIQGHITPAEFGIVVAAWPLFWLLILLNL